LFITVFHAVSCIYDTKLNTRLKLNKRLIENIFIGA
jgi:hypothetical protein